MEIGITNNQPLTDLTCQVWKHHQSLFSTAATTTTTVIPSAACTKIRSRDDRSQSPITAPVLPPFPQQAKIVQPEIPYQPKRSLTPIPYTSMGDNILQKGSMSGRNQFISLNNFKVDKLPQNVSKRIDNYFDTLLQNKAPILRNQNIA